MLMFLDTVENFPTLDASSLGEVETNKLAKSAGVVVVDCLCISKRFQNRAKIAKIAIIDTTLLGINQSYGLF